MQLEFLSSRDILLLSICGIICIFNGINLLNYRCSSHVCEFLFQIAIKCFYLFCMVHRKFNFAKSWNWHSILVLMKKMVLWIKNGKLLNVVCKRNLQIGKILFEISLIEKEIFMHAYEDSQKLTKDVILQCKINYMQIS